MLGTWWTQLDALAMSFVDGIGIGPSSGMFSSIALGFSSFSLNIPFGTRAVPNVILAI
jgi:hypothetical protein